jgi:hypothetical protein
VDENGVLHLATGGSGVLQLTDQQPIPRSAPGWPQHRVSELAQDAGGD